MKKHFLPRLVLVFAILFFSSPLVKSQVLEVTSEITPEEMVEILIGSGLEYSNVVFTGNDVSRGQFWGGPGNIGVSHGIILTSGNVIVAPGPNTSSGAGYNCGTEGDDDLEILSGSNDSWDACILEFDFVPYYELTWFEFVFASEEYHEYVDQFNDAFGFFMSGPGISGPFTNGSANIALIPLSDIPITINTVNCGNPYNCQVSCENCQFFVNNNGGFTQYDAFTTVLTAWAETVPMETYHIKLAISDMLDHVYDSGVFLQASSFCSGPVTGVAGQDQKEERSNYSIYPLPAGDVLNIVSLDGQYFDIKLIGQDGRNCKSDSGNSRYSLDLTSLPSGIYFLTITGSNGTETRKIFKN